MRLELDPSIETFFLLLNPRWGKEQKKEAIEKLDDFGINGVAFYSAHFPAIERYHAAFASKMIDTEGRALFENMSEELVYFFAAMILYHPEWLDDLNAVSDEDVLPAVREGITDLVEGQEDIIGALEASGFSDQTKWQLTALLQQPKQRLALVIDAINSNLAAFEYAASKLEAETTPLLARLEEQLEKEDLPAVAHQSLQFSSQAKIVPSMAAALGLMVLDDFCVYGLLVNRLFVGEDEGFSKEEALLAAKALGDASKLEIMFALKNSKLYNLEIARILDLTPATTSHHMNMLLSAGLVEVSKEDGKAYYSLSAKGLKRYRDWLDESLL